MKRPPILGTCRRCDRRRDTVSMALCCGAGVACGLGHGRADNEPASRQKERRSDVTIRGVAKHLSVAANVTVDSPQSIRVTTTSDAPGYREASPQKPVETTSLARSAILGALLGFAFTGAVIIGIVWRAI